MSIHYNPKVIKFYLKIIINGLLRQHLTNIKYCGAITEILGNISLLEYSLLFTLIGHYSGSDSF